MSQEKQPRNLTTQQANIHLVLHDIRYVFLKCCKLNMWCLVVISLGFVRRGEISMVGKTSGQLSLGAGTGENALGNPESPA